MKILVVEDDAVCRMMTSQTLKNAGYEVLTARDGREALKLLQETHIQLVVSDWDMPSLDGVELCRAIRGYDFRRYIYFILLTSHAQLQDTIAGLEAGADDFITKPFNPAELILRVNVGRRTVALDTRDLTIFTMGKLAGSRDAETGAHLERISIYSRILAEWLLGQNRKAAKIDEEFVQLIFKTSPMHDIGKIAIPDCILQKPDQLDENEFGIMKLHTLLGARMLDAALREFPNANYLRMARDIALSHHERFDGRGYPQRLADNAIPLAGRIVALADVYDALTTKRIYKDAYSHAFASSIITDKSRGQFDPLIIEAFQAEEEQFEKTCSDFAEENNTDPHEFAAAAFAFLDERITHDNTYLSSTDCG